MQGASGQEARLFWPLVSIIRLTILFFICLSSTSQQGAVATVSRPCVCWVSKYTHAARERESAERKRESLPRNIWRSICEESLKKIKIKEGRKEGRKKMVCTLCSLLDLSEMSSTESYMTSLTAGAVSSKHHLFSPNTLFPILVSFFLPRPPFFTAS